MAEIIEYDTDDWKFLVLIGGFFITLCLKLPIIAYGLMYSKFLMNSDVSSTTVSWIFNISFLVSGFFGIFVGPLYAQFGWRKVTFAAGLSFGFSLIIAGFVNSHWWLFFTHGILLGIAQGILIVGNQTVVPFYFPKGRGIALGIQFSGYSVGDFILPPIVIYLQKNFGERSALFLLGALLFNICVVAMVYHPVEWHRKKCKEKLTVSQNNITNKISKEHLTKLNLQEKSILKTTNLNCMKSNSTNPHLLSTIKEILISSFQNLKMLKQFRVIIISSSYAMMVFSITNIFSNLPFALNERGLPKDTIMLCLSSMGISSLICRNFVLAISDKLDISKRWFLISALAAIGTASIGFGFSGSRTFWIIASLMLYSGGAAVMPPMATLAIIEIMGIEMLPSIVGVNGLFYAIFIAIFGPLFGVVRDATQNFSLTIQLMATIQVLSIVAWLLVPLAVSFDEKKIKATNTRL